MSQIKTLFPRFITIEGGEGAGKTTLLNRLEELLHLRDFPFVRTREPGGSSFGNEVRRWVLAHRQEINIGAKAELLLFLAARAQHIEEVIAPAIDAGKIVICDRFNDSTIAYQGAGRGLGTAWVQSLCKMVCGPIMPDLTFYLDIDPNIGLKRTRAAAKEDAGAGTVDRIESEQIAFHQHVREAFIAIAKQEPNRFHCLDANQSPLAVYEAAAKVLLTYLSR